MQGDDLIAAGRLGCNTKRATDLIGELGDAVELGAALNLSVDECKIASSKARSGATCTDAITVCLVEIFNYEGKDFAGKVCVLASVLDAFED